jgi:ATP-dependent RNA helicase DDX31/DBP7
MSRAINFDFENFGFNLPKVHPSHHLVLAAEMSDDDGLLLNFAAPVARAPPKRSNGKKSHERSRVNNGTSQKPVAASPPQAPATSQSEIQQPSTRPQPTSELQTTRSKAIVNVPAATEERISQNYTASTSTRTTSLSKPSAAPINRSGFISSLFTGADKGSKASPKEVRESNGVDAIPTNAPSAGTAFGALGLDPLLVAHLQTSKVSIERPTSIQRNSLPFLLAPEHAGRDALLHAQTGSGKTLSYLLPIIQSLLPLCETSWIDRSCLGTIAIILAPTRELAHQIYEVAEKLCNLHLAEKSGSDDNGGEGSSTRRTRWIVPGLLSGGATRNHEKSRLRKGLPLIVATPGRLLDHLRNTTSLDVGRLQWLVLDEADRLLHLGFEQTLSDIMKAIDGRRRATCEAQRERMIKELGSQYQGQPIADKDVMDTFGEQWWKHPRRTILCSATLDEGVQVLAGKSLSNPRVIRGDPEKEANGSEAEMKKQTTMTAPAQLKQNYIIMPTKQRLVVLIALLRQAISSGKSKIMVFLSCTDSVDFHWSALGGVRMTAGEEASKTDKASPLQKESDLLPSTSVFKLHGSLSQHERQSSLKLFSQCKQSAVLICTSVASRGLDLDISLVVQMDAPSEKGVDEYLHRIGRTARVGVSGESWLLLLPSEEGCVAAYEKAMGSGNRSTIVQREPDEILRKGFTAQDLYQTQIRATEVQMAFEKWVLESEEHATLARKAYLSHLRAYATHPPSEWQYFSISKLQLGHLAKAFALREAPGVIRSKHKMSRNKATKEAAEQAGTQQPGRKRKRATDVEETVNVGGAESSDDSDDDTKEPARKHLDFARNKATEAKMYAKVREMGKLNRQKGVLGAYGVDEYQIGV